MGPAWTATGKLPGGEFPQTETAARIAEFGKRHPFLSPVNAKRIFRAYGTLAEEVIGDARSTADLGQNFGLLSEREVNYLTAREWARTADDILWRRSKLGLHLKDDEQTALRDYLAGASTSAQRRVSTG
jgi:glycerol-3-phosphate dehydrogenase